MSVVPMSRAARAQPYFWALQEAGVDVERRLAKSQLPSSLLYDPDIAIPSRTVFAFIDRVARKDGIENISLLGAELDGVRNLEPWLRDYLLGASTLKQLLDRYCRVARYYISYRRYRVEITDELAGICSTADLSITDEAFLRLSDWSNLLLLLRVFRRVLGEAFQPTAVTFQTNAELTHVEREKLAGIRVYQGWTNTSILLPAALLATPLPDALRKVPCKDLPDGMVAPADFSTQLNALLQPCLSEDWLDVNATVEMAGCSVRTLQRRLSASGLTFSELLDQCRMSAARSLLKDSGNRVIDVGIEVGFEDASHFARAFRRVHGITPTEFRKKILAGKPTSGTAQEAAAVQP